VKFVIRPAAREDILRQYQYYLIEADDERIAARFLNAVESTIAQVCKQPGIGAPKVLRNMKLAGLRSSPVEGFPIFVCTTLSQKTCCGSFACYMARETLIQYLRRNESNQWATFGLPIFRLIGELNVESKKSFGGSQVLDLPGTILLAA
jgi:plasmid stabilization system protein ParE